MPGKWIGSAINAIIFPYFLRDKERQTLQDYFHLGFTEEISLFFFEVEDPARNQKLCAEMIRKLKK